MYIDYLETPIGSLEIKASKNGVTHVIFIESDHSFLPVCCSDITNTCKQQLQEYFSGKRTTFSVLFDQYGTPFQKSVWSSLLNISFGDTASYKDIANSIQNPKAVRAVGAANGKNPISIIVPCHRVIGSNHTLTGYAGGLDRKLWLLKHEGVDI